MALTQEEFDEAMAEHNGSNIKTFPNSDNVDMNQRFTLMEQEAYERENSPYNKDWKALRAVENSLKTFGKGLVDAVVMARDVNIKAHLEQDPEYQMNDIAASLDELSNADIFKKDPVASASGVGQFGLDIAQGAGQFLLSLLAAPVVGPGGVAALNSLSIAGEEYNDLRWKGVEVEEAAKASAANATLQLPMEYIGLSKIFKRLPVGTSIAGYGREFLERAATEGLTEYLQEYPDEISRIWALNSDKPIEEIVEKVKDELGNIHKQGLYSGAIGAILGGAVGGAHIALSNRIQDNIEREVHEYKLGTVEKQIDNIIETGTKPEVVAAVVDSNQGQTVYVDASTITTYAQESGVPIKDIAWSLGVDEEELKKAADDGDYMDITLGRYEGTAAKHKGFFQATKNDVAFEDGGITLNTEQQRREAIARDRANAESLQVEQDKVLADLLRAGVGRDVANNVVSLLTSRAMIANPDNPAKWMRVTFQKGSNAAAAGFGQDNPNFKKWFGNSKAVDSEGKPLVVYHGTADEFSVFENSKSKNGKAWGKGHYFTENKADADQYGKNTDQHGSGHKVMPLNLRVENPLELQADTYDNNIIEALPQDVLERIRDEYGDNFIREYLENGYAEDFEIADWAEENLQDYLRSMGYDGIVGEHAGERNWVAFNSNQIKSVDNNGEYSLENNNIYKQVAPDSVAQQQMDEVRKQYEGHEGEWMRAPNGKPTNLTEEQWLLVRTDAFCEWFGDWENDPENASAALDENGEPKIYYHGTKHATFDTFKHKGKGVAENVFFFSDSLQTAQIYAKTGKMASPKDVVSADDFAKRLAKANKKLADALESIIGDKFDKNDFLEQLDDISERAYQFVTKDETVMAEWNDLDGAEALKGEFSRLMNNTMRKYEKEGEENLAWMSSGSSYGVQFIILDSDLHAAQDNVYATQASLLEGYDITRAIGEDGGSYAVFLNVRNPEIYKGHGEQWDDIKPQEYYGEELPEDSTTTTDLYAWAAHEHGYDGTIFNNINDGGGPSQVVVVHDPNQIKSATDNNGEFSRTDNNIYHQEGGELKGMFDPNMQDGKYVISLFNGADASTVIHEIGHYFVESMWAMIKAGEASELTMKDFDTLLKYAGMTREQWEAADVDGRRAAHEKLAEAFETYIMEAKAPSQQLRRVFQRFANWVKSVYQSIQRNGNAAPINDEVRQVFDRMLAVQEDIEEAERISGYFNDLPNVVTDNMSDATRNRVENFIAKARDKAADILTRRAMETFSDERKERVAAFRAEILPEVEQAVKARRVYKTGYNRTDARKYIRQVQRGLSDEEGLWVMQFDLTAESMGYSSASEMVQDILNSPTEKQAVTIMLNARVREEFPDYATDKAAHEEAVREAIYNDDTGLLIGVEQQLIQDYAMEQAARENERQRTREASQQEAQPENETAADDNAQMTARTPQEARVLGTVAEQAIDRQRTMEELRARAAAFRQQARNMARDAVSRMIIRDAVRTQKYVTLERGAAVKSAVAMKNKDYREAYRQKNLQAYYHAMVQETMRARKLVEKNRRYLRRQVAAKRDAWVSEPHFAEVSRLFERMGIARSKHDSATGRVGTSLRDYMEAMNEKYDVADFPEWLIALPDNESLTDTRMFTIEQFDDMTNAVRNIRAIAKTEKGANMFGKAKSFEDLKKIILQQLSGLPVVFKPDPNQPTQATVMERMGAAMENIDTFFARMDKWKEGWFTNTFLTRIKHANDQEFIYREKYDNAVVEANKKWMPDKASKAAANEAIYYEEIGTSVSKHILVKMLINMGNKENAQRLCETVPIGFEKSTLWTRESEEDGVTRQAAAEETAKNIIEFLGKHLTKNDVQYAQELVDAAEMFWSEKQALEIKLKGFGMRKVEATPRVLNIRNGQNVLRGEEVIFSGGYFPLMRNGEMGSHPASQTVDENDPLQGRNIRTLHTNQSTTKKRTGARYPVNLFPGAETQVMYDSIHDLCWRECANDYRRVLNDPELFAALKTHLGPARMRVFREMLEKAAQPYNTYSADIAESTVGNVCSILRNKVSSAMIMMNIKINIQNLGNIFLYGNTVEGFTHKDVFAALGNWKMNFASAEGYANLTEFVLSKSAFMRERTYVPDITLRDIQDDITHKQTDVEKWVQRVGSRMLGFTDGLTAKPVWAQAYQKALNEGKSEQEAIDWADMIIRRTLGSVRMTDVSSLQRGGPIFKMLTMFQSFFNTQYNQWKRELSYDQKLRMEGKTKEAYERMFSFFMAKYLLTCMASLALGLQNPFGKDDEDGWLRLAKEMKNYPLSMLGPAGQVGSAAIGHILGMHEFDYRMSVVQSTLDKAIKTGDKVVKVVQGKASVAEGAEAVTNIAGLAVGIPTQVNKNFWNLYDVIFNDMQPRLEDFVQRRPKKERKD